MNRVVVGIDGTSRCIAALGWAVDAANRRDAQLLVALAGDIPEPWDRALADAPDPSTTTIMAALRAAIRHGLRCDVDTVVRDTDPVDLLVDLSADALMVVVGSGRESMVRSVSGGSVARRVAAHACCPTVLVPEDFTGTGAGAHAQRPGPVVLAPPGPCVDDAAAAFAEAEGRLRHTAVVRLPFSGRIPAVVTSATDDALSPELIVVSRARPAPGRPSLWGVPSRLIAAARCPVAVVPPL